MTNQELVQAIEAKGHVLIRENGKVDFVAMSVDDPDIGGGHNGPRCSLCRLSWCEHCFESSDDVNECGVKP